MLIEPSSIWFRGVQFLPVVLLVLSSCQFVCFYTVVQILSEEFSNSEVKSPTKIRTVHTVSDRVVRHSLAHLSMQKWFAWDVPLLHENLAETDLPLQKHRFPINIRL